MASQNRHLDCCNTVKIFSHYCTILDVEDQENWHGKPLGGKADAALAAIRSLISDPGPYKVTRPEVIEDAKYITPEVIKLSEPPNYKLGDKVSYFNRGYCSAHGPWGIFVRCHFPVAFVTRAFTPIKIKFGTVQRT